MNPISRLKACNAVESRLAVLVACSGRQPTPARIDQIHEQLGFRARRDGVRLLGEPWRGMYKRSGTGLLCKTEMKQCLLAPNLIFSHPSLFSGLLAQVRVGCTKSYATTPSFPVPRKKPDSSICIFVADWIGIALITQW